MAVFAVPVRKQYADAVVLVTSGESMSIYAANNILCGIKNLNPQGRQIAGIIYNSRGVGDDRKYVEDFTNAVNLPILAEIPRSNLFTQAEKEAMTLVEKSPKSAEANIFLELAQKLQTQPVLYAAAPLSEEQMELFMRGERLSHTTTTISKHTSAPVIPAVPAQPSATKRELYLILLAEFRYMAVLIVVLSIWRFISKMPQFSDMLPKAAPGMPLTVLPATDEEDCMNAESFTRPLFQDSLRILISP